MTRVGSTYRTTLLILCGKIIRLAGVRNQEISPLLQRPRFATRVTRILAAARHGTTIHSHRTAQHYTIKQCRDQRGHAAMDPPFIRCVGCDIDVSHRSFVTIKDSAAAVTASNDNCHHTFCIRLLGQAQALRSAHVKLKCPATGCNRQFRERSISEFSDGMHTSPVVQKIVLPVYNDRDKKRHPSLYFSNRCRAYR